MDGSPAGSIIIFIVCLIGCVMCAAAETAFAAVEKVRVMTLSENGDRRAKRVCLVLDNFDRAISTNLICNNVCSIGCATTSTVLAIRIGGNSAVTFATIITTVIVFFFAEMLPKKLAKDCSLAISFITAPITLLMMKLLRPVVWLFSAVTGVISRLILGGGDAGVTYTERELDDIIENVSEDVEIPPESGRLIKSAYEFSSKPVSAVMTSWGNTVVVNADDSYEKVTGIAKSTTHTRFPVVDNGTPIGVLHIRHYLKCSIIQGSDDVTPANIMLTPLFIDENMSAPDAIELMSREKTNLALVRKGSSVVGIVTVEDIIEELVGDMNDETDPEVTT